MTDYTPDYPMDYSFVESVVPPVAAKPVAVAAKPIAVAAKPVAVAAKPVAVAAKPVAVPAKPAAAKTKKIVPVVVKVVTTRTEFVLNRFVALLVTAMAVASGLAWKDVVVSWFAKGGILGFLNYGPFAYATIVTLAGALLTIVQTKLPKPSS